MIPAIVCSRNRAMQLDALLRSMDHFAPGVFGPVLCLCHADYGFGRGYQTLSERCHPRGQFMMKEASFMWDFSQNLAWLSSAHLNVALFTDDDIFYRAVRDEDVRLPEDALCVSLRLGKNISYCYTIDQPQKEGELDFLYQWSMDGHIYRSLEVQAFTPLHVRSMETTPNKWEAAINSRTPRDPRRIVYGEHSCVVNIPHNIVQNDYKNRHAGGSAEELNARFLAGERIDFLSMDFSNVRGCHQEIPYVFKVR